METTGTFVGGAMEEAGSMSSKNGNEGVAMSTVEGVQETACSASPRRIFQGAGNKPIPWNPLGKATPTTKI
ncbi:MAG TPA: hypothetical protein VFF76_11500 [Holophagaceae bacterium]|jgi:hypothetical protein|nr:hypothetical protein [Holophagaceae bacterium]